MENIQNIQDSKPFLLKGSLFTLTVLKLVHTDLSAIDKALAAMVKKTPKFFQNTPMVIELPLHSTLDLVALQAVLQSHGIIPVGIRGGRLEDQENALKSGLAVLPVSKTEPVRTVSSAAQNSLAPIPRASKLITTPVRSGQQIYAKDSDLVVTAPVSHGAELLADGHIHVYGPLRGRALAGVQGDTNARIFCHSLQAQLISIAGHYQVNEDIKIPAQKGVTQIYLENEQLKIGNL